MKKLVILGVLLASITGLVFADETDTKKTEESFQTVSFLIKNGLNKNYSQIQEEALNLTNSQRLTLYGLNENKFGVPLVLNILVGFGLGSAIQRDTGGAVVGLLGDLTGSILLIVGLLQTSNALDEYSSQLRKANTYSDIEKALQKYENKTESALRTMIASGVIFGVSRVAQIIMPPIYSNKYNKKLQSVLNYNDISFDMVPAVDFDGNVKLTLAMTYRY